MFFLFFAIIATELTELPSIHVPLRIIMASTTVYVVRLLFIYNKFYISYSLIPLYTALATFSFKYFVSALYFLQLVWSVVPYIFTRRAPVVSLPSVFIPLTIIKTMPPVLANIDHAIPTCTHQ